MAARDNIFYKNVNQFVSVSSSSIQCGLSGRTMTFFIVSEFCSGIFFFALNLYNDSEVSALTVFEAVDVRFGLAV